MNFSGLKFVFLCLGLMIGGEVFTQPTINRLYGTYNTETGKAAVVMPDSTAYLLGSSSAFTSLSSQVYLIHIDKNGDIIWSKFYGGTGVDNGTDIYYDGDTSLYLLSTSYINAQKSYDVKIIRTNLNGALIWEKNYGTTDWDITRKLIGTSTGELIVCGTTYGNTAGLADGMVMAINANGDSLWFKTVGNVYDNELLDIKEHSANKVVACGESESSTGLKRAWLVELNTLTLAAQEKFFGSAFNKTFNALDIKPNGDYYLGCTADSVAGSGWNMFMYVLDDTTKNELGIFPLSGSNDDVCVDVMFLNNEYLILGNTNSYGLGYTDAVLYRFDLGGWYINGYTFGTIQNDEISSIVKNNSGTVALIGTGEYVYGGNDLWYINTDNAFDLVSDAPDSELDINSVEEPENNTAVRVFPNPFDAEITIQTDKLVRSILIADVSGKTIVLSGNLNQINLEFLSVGYYVLYVNLENDVQLTYKLIKK